MSTQQATSLLYGFLPLVPGSAATLALNATTNYAAFSFIAQSSAALSACRFRCTAKSGTGGTINIKVWADLNGSPDTATVIDTLTVGTLTANTWVNCTGGTVGLTQGTKYWVGVYNTDGTPASNNITVSYMAASTAPSTGDATATSTNTGSTWTVRAGSGGMRFDFAGGFYYGMPVQTSSTSSGTTQVYSTRELGIQFTTPASVSWNVAGIIGGLSTVTGTPTGNPYFRLRDSSHTLIADTDQIANGEARNQTNVFFKRMFTSGYGNQILRPSTTYTITLAESTQSDTSSNAFPMRQYVWDSDSNSIALIPWSMQQDFYDGSTWTQTSGTILPMGLIVVSGGEFNTQFIAPPPLVVGRGSPY